MHPACTTNQQNVEILLFCKSRLLIYEFVRWEWANPSRGSAKSLQVAVFAIKCCSKLALSNNQFKEYNLQQVNHGVNG
ncbi:hypothetical protein BDA96_03G277100 [Sorghum bicolor]|uniref:Uncharacterized protein n=2 Tax=Sorghum bicolor TaxID=4558 RepID=A0A921REP0_SORBI|nr:hypothetical protein BDA96_03G277100 [Sorghum bicolor]KXG33114.1 hypothetical protein SORBI_3003G256400 [Sorghum bicolor]